MTQGFRSHKGPTNFININNSCNLDIMLPHLKKGISFQTIHKGDHRRWQGQRNRQDVKLDHMRSEEVTEGHMRGQEVNMHHMRSHGVEIGSMRSHGVKRGEKR